MNIVDVNGSPVRGDSDTLQSAPLETVESRLKPRQVGSGPTRGTQIVGYGSTKIDGANNRILIDDPADDGGLILGDLSDEDSAFGLSVSDSTGVERLRAGEYPDGSIKIKLSQPTYDVSTATDDQLIWSSDFNSFKVVQTGTIALSGHTLNTGGAGEYGIASSDAVVTHNLGYKPLVIATINGGTTIPRTLFDYAGLNEFVITSIDFTATTSTVTFQQYSFGLAVSGYSVGGYTVQYYLLRETAN